MPSRKPELGDESAQLRRLADATKARLRRAQEETEQATQALKQVKEVLVEQCQLAEQENFSLWTNF
jgi:predicted nucleic acid-binding protein